MDGIKVLTHLVLAVDFITEIETLRPSSLAWNAYCNEKFISLQFSLTNFLYISSSQLLPLLLWGWGGGGMSISNRKPTPEHLASLVSFFPGPVSLQTEGSHLYQDDTGHQTALGLAVPPTHSAAAGIPSRGTSQMQAPPGHQQWSLSLWANVSVFPQAAS